MTRQRRWTERENTGRYEETREEEREIRKEGRYLRTNKEGKEQEKTEWHRVSFFGKLAEVVGEHLRKGHPIYLEGRLQTRKWKDKEGREQHTTEVVAERMQMLGKGNGRDDAPQPDKKGIERPPRSSDTSAPQKPKTTASMWDDIKDDIPF